MRARAIIESFAENGKNHSFVTDIAADFVELEVGRFDWQNNWENFKKRNNAKAKIAEWLNYLEINADPEAIYDRIDEMARDWRGSWK